MYMLMLIIILLIIVLTLANPRAQKGVRVPTSRAAQRLSHEGGARFPSNPLLRSTPSTECEEVRALMWPLFFVAVHVLCGCVLRCMCATPTAHNARM